VGAGHKRPDGGKNEKCIGVFSPVNEKKTQGWGLRFATAGKIKDILLKILLKWTTNPRNMGKAGGCHDRRERKTRKRTLRSLSGVYSQGFHNTRLRTGIEGEGYI